MIWTVNQIIKKSGFKSAGHTLKTLTNHYFTGVNQESRIAKSRACCIKPLTAFKISQIRLLFRQDNLILLSG